MKVLLLSNSYKLKGTGVARYTRQVYSGLMLFTNMQAEIITFEPERRALSKIFNHMIKSSFESINISKNYDIIHILTPAMALHSFIGKLIRPYVVTFHEVSFLFRNIHGYTYYTLTSPLWYKLATKGNMIIAVSTLTKMDLINYLKIPENKIVVINPAIEEYFKPINNPFKRLEKKDTYTMGYVGKLGKKKNIVYALEAFYGFKKKYPEIKANFFIAGPRDKTDHLRVLIERLGLSSNVKFLGTLSENELINFYNYIDILLFPSKWEGFGYPILEAQRCGTPVIVNDKARIPPETTKFALKAKSKEDMINKIYKLLVEIEYRNKIVKKGLEYASQFNLKKMASKLFDLYSKVSWR